MAGNSNLIRFEENRQWILRRWREKLVDERTASAAEAFAGIIKAYRRGIVVGAARTFGKGTGQSSKKTAVDFLNPLPF